MIHQAVYNTSQICHQLGVRVAVLSPGSRNAPLTISFARNKAIQKFIIPDERAAAFIALGIAQESKSPVVLACTSGTALLNYAPAIAEAYYRQIPLIVLSADRPPELIDQRDGQTIRQYEALKNHVKASYQLPTVQDEQDASLYQSMLLEGLRETLAGPKGPAHLNIPFREPFYPSKDQTFQFNEVNISKAQETDQGNEKIDITGFGKILLLVGQQDYNHELENVLTVISNKIPIISSPLNNISLGIENVDAFIKDQKELQPDLLITSGLSVLSKNLKTFLRKNKPTKHLHFDPGGVAVDTYLSSPQLITTEFQKFIPQLNSLDTNDDYYAEWLAYSQKAGSAIKSFMGKASFSESTTTWAIIKDIPKDTHFHVSNSMPVRFVDLYGIRDGVETFSNRGTSGIDGCTSTAVGASLVSNKLNVLLTGDLAFLYDRNAFFHNYKTPNLRIIIINNEGGGIFRLINGPSGLEELEEYFETRHNRTAKYICLENGLDYIPVRNSDELHSQLTSFWNEAENAKVMEVFTDPETNQRVYKELRNYIYERINN